MQVQVLVALAVALAVQVLVAGEEVAVGMGAIVPVTEQI